MPRSWRDLCCLDAPGESKSGVEFSPFLHSLSVSGLIEPILFLSNFIFSSLMSINNFMDVHSHVTVIPLIKTI